MRDARLGAEIAVKHHVAEFAVNRHRVLRIEQIDHLAQFIAPGVPRNVHALVLGAVHHGGAAPEEVVDRAGDAFLVAGDRRGRDEDGVADSNAQLRVLGGGDARQRGGGFTLAAGEHDDALFLRQFQGFIERNEQSFRRGEVAELAGGAGVLLHAPAGHGHLAIPYFSAAASAMWMRLMFEAKVAIST